MKEILTKKDILERLSNLDRELSVYRIEKEIKLLIVGSSFVILKYENINFRPTRDIDVSVILKSNPFIVTTGLGPQMGELAEKYDINDSVYTFLSMLSELERFENLVEINKNGFKNFRAYIPSVEFYVLMKFNAYVGGRSTRNDLDDILLDEIISDIDIIKMKELFDEAILYRYPKYMYKVIPDEDDSLYKMEINKFLSTLIKLKEKG